MADPTIKQGSKGTAVSKAQGALVARGYKPGPVDGVFGPRTHSAVRGYQHDRREPAQDVFGAKIVEISAGLQVDGIVGPKTWARLAPPTIRRGSTGSAVKLAQLLVVIANHDPLAIDGIFGPRTEQVIRNFQTTFKLTPDGVVGPRTWAALRS